MMMRETEVMRKQKTMFPAVSIRAFPEGNLLPSTRFTARRDTIRVMLDRGSKRASAMVVNSESDLDDAAA
jgi:hypothetical protein